MNIETNKSGYFAIIDDDFLPTLLKHAPRLNLNYTTYRGGISIHSVITQTTLRLSRLVMNRLVDDGYDIDHIDNNTLNNLKANLRVSTPSQNCMNRGKQKGTFKSKYKNVTFSKKSDKWYVRITANKKTLDGGYFEDEILAALRADDLMLIHHGEFARLNFPIMYGA